jgi:hypothetical protein
MTGLRYEFLRCRFPSMMLMADGKPALFLSWSLEVRMLERGGLMELGLWVLPADEWPPPYPGGPMVFCLPPGALTQIPPNFHPGSTDRDDGGGQ